MKGRCPVLRPFERYGIPHPIVGGMLVVAHAKVQAAHRVDYRRNLLQSGVTDRPWRDDGNVADQQESNRGQPGHAGTRQRQVGQRRQKDRKGPENAARQGCQGERAAGRQCDEGAGTAEQRDISMDEDQEKKRKERFREQQVVPDQQRRIETQPSRRQEAALRSRSCVPMR